MKKHESGQVLLVGIVMIVVLLLLIFILADVHNMIRGKLKLETAQQSAALAAAEWQRESLNLIGEINLIKASQSLLPPPEETFLLQQEYDLLTEMQTRISFLGPLVGFAAAQQAAKANGFNGRTDIDDAYLKDLHPGNEYYFPKADSDIINNYRWFSPYRNLLETISANGIAVRPNVNKGQVSSTHPSELNIRSLYYNIMRHAADLKAGPPNYQIAWDYPLRSLVEPTSSNDFDPEHFYDGLWWEIFFSSRTFIRQSEIYTLFVKKEKSDDYTDYPADFHDEYTQNTLRNSPVITDLLTPDELLFLSPDWFRYDLHHWDPVSYQRKFNKSADTHYHDWFDGEIMLKAKVKQQYQYEGPAAYAETGIKMPRLSDKVTPDSSGEKGYNIFRTTPVAPITILGAARSVTDARDVDHNDRPGAAAKTFGNLRNNTPPIAIELVLPVFHTSGIVPTYSVRPYDFNILYRPSLLQDFLEWLAGQTSLSGTPPDGTELFQTALKYLEDGPGFRYYGWNPDFSEGKFNQQWGICWDEYYKKRNKEPFELIYHEKLNPSGPGWLQEPRYYGPSCGISIRKGDIKRVSNNLDPAKQATVRIFGIGTDMFYAIWDDDTVVTNGDPDPIRLYLGNIEDPGNGNGFFVPDIYDPKPGPPRL